MNKVVRILLIAILFAMLIAVRVFQGFLFYDPLMPFFKQDHSILPLPDFKVFQLLIHIIFRFGLNTLISLAILWMLFKKWELIKFSALFYGILLLVLMIPFAFLINSNEIGNHLPLFYIRRFLIQPLFLLLLIPAFYFQKKT